MKKSICFAIQDVVVYESAPIDFDPKRQQQQQMQSLRISIPAQNRRGRKPTTISIHKPVAAVRGRKGKQIMKSV